jgi:hypothetical protein
VDHCLKFSGIWHSGVLFVFFSFYLSPSFFNLPTMVTINLEYTGDLRTVATHEPSGTVIQTDAPTDNMGKGEFFSPTDLCATALGSCIITTIGIKGLQKGSPGQK